MSRDRIRSLTIALTAIAAIATVSAFAAESRGGPTAPPRRAGLWKSTSTGIVDGQKAAGGHSVLEECVDAASERQHMFGNFEMVAPQCTMEEVHRTSKGFTYKGVCDGPSVRISTRGRVAGDLRRRYTVWTETDFQPHGGEPPMHTKAVTRARWSGSCPSGMVPGGTRIR